MQVTDAQIQAFVDQKIRPQSEAMRNLANTLTNEIAMIDDIYATVSQPSTTWTDARTDGVPHLATPANILAYNALIHRVRDAIINDPEYHTIQSLCVKDN